MKTTAAAKQTKNQTCTRCEGKGHISFYKHVLGGTCFKCGGSGTQKVTRKREAKPNAAKEAQRQANAAATKEAYTILEALYGDTVAAQSAKLTEQNEWQQRRINEALVLEYQKATGKLWKTRPHENLGDLQKLAAA